MTTHSGIYYVNATARAVANQPVLQQTSLKKHGVALVLWFCGEFHGEKVYCHLIYCYIRRIVSCIQRDARIWLTVCPLHMILLASRATHGFGLQLTFAEICALKEAVSWIYKTVMLLHNTGWNSRTGPNSRTGWQKLWKINCRTGPNKRVQAGFFLSKK